MRRNHTKTDTAVTDAFAEPLATMAPTHEQAVQMSKDVDAIFAAMDAEDLDIPAETLANDAQLEAEPETPVTKPVYRWEIPLDSNPGYVLPIEITEAASVEHARNAALAITLGATEIEEGRNLSAMEQAWVKATEPKVVRDAESITLDHDAALRENARLQAENVLYASAKRILAEHGIDPNNPLAWAEAQMAEAASVAKAAIDAQDGRQQRLAAKLAKLRSELDVVIDETGFAPPKPPVPQEPDYSKLTVLVDDPAVMQQYPRLAAANVVVTDPSEPLTEEEAAGFAMIFRDDAGFIDQYLRGFPTPAEEIQLRAIRGRLRALFGG